MKRSILWSLVLLLILSTSVFYSCSDDDDKRDIEFTGKWKIGQVTFNDIDVTPFLPLIGKMLELDLQQLELAFEGSEMDVLIAGQKIKSSTYTFDGNVFSFDAGKEVPPILTTIDITDYSVEGVSFSKTVDKVQMTVILFAMKNFAPEYYDLIEDYLDLFKNGFTLTGKLVKSNPTATAFLLN